MPKSSLSIRKWATGISTRREMSGSILYGHFRIAYLVRDDGNVDILGVFRGSLDIAKYQL